MKSFILVFIGGGLGSIIRYVIATFFSQNIKTNFPISTLISNITSCLIMGFITYILTQKNFFNQEIKALLIIGLCGGLSTFSTFSIETYTLIKQSNFYYAFANILISVLSCLLILYLTLRKAGI
jgi:CrcB protein